MATTRNILNQLKPQLDESMGMREHDSRPQLSPVPNKRDVGRRALRSFGTLAIENLMTDPGQPRVDFDDGEIENLARSILEKGQFHPIRVRWSEQHEKWVIISGERRYRAAKRAGLATIDCFFQEGELSQTEVLEQQLVENLLREDLKPIEEAKAFRSLMALNAWTAKELSQALRVSSAKIARSLALLKLPADVQEMVERGSVSSRAAYEASKLESAEQQRRAISNADNRTGGASIERVQRQVRSRKGAASERVRGTKQTFTTEGGWKVTVTSGRKGNYHEIEAALQQAIDEVRLRIENNVHLS